MQREFLALLAVAAGFASAQAAPVEFNRDVRPILSDKCFKCHGPDSHARKADLRLDVRDSALAPNTNGTPIVPGKPDESELIRLIESKDPGERMPPRKENVTLSESETATLRRWIAEGAHYQPLWSLVPPRPAPPPAVRKSNWPRNDIDRFALAKLESQQLAPAKPAEKATLLRRVSLDLTGLPPTLQELDAFLADPSPQAYERAVDRLLASPHFGERMAIDWLDAARYADTNGYFRDANRSAWPWRDWVIQAFNRNQPYDQFALEQLAGDLLPDATTEQKIATGFNRNNMTTNESGIIEEEYRVEYIVDRLDTTSTVFMGLTVACARCHDHKFDPVSQKEFYQLFAFFNNTPETGLVKTFEDPLPVMDVASAEQRSELDNLQKSRKAAEAQFDQLARALQGPMAEWEKNALTELNPPTQNLVYHVGFEPEPTLAEEKGNVSYERGILGQAATFDGMQHLEIPAQGMFEAERAWSIGIWLRATGPLNGVVAKIESGDRRRGFEMVWQKGRIQVNLVSQWGARAITAALKEPMRGSPWHHVVVTYDGSRKAAGLRIFVDGDDTPLNVTLDNLDGPTTNSEPLRLGRRDSGLGFNGQLDEMRLLGRAITEREARAWFWSDRLRGILPVGAEKRDAREKQALLDYYVSHHAEQAVRAAYAVVAAAREAESAFRAQLPKTLVMQEMPKPRVTKMLMRGQYDQPGERVEADVPASLPRLAADAPRNRLGLAQWLINPSHPLTARVAVNRLWQLCFGEGFVRTGNDFGAQGDPPTHPELLDWLALRFVESGWNVKEMLRLIVTSATYRQSSATTPALLQRDPENRLHARGPRFRLPAETIRDQALAGSGLLVPRIGGPGVKPYQPVGLWEMVSYDGELSYEQDQGDSLWRRSLYTFWKRQSPPPAMLTFDSPTRETCSVRRMRTNTPLQALVLLNDPTYVEAGRALGALAMAQPGDDEARLRFLFRRVTSRSPDAGELTVLRQLLAQQRKHFMSDREAARRFVAVGLSPAGRSLDSAQVAAWGATAHALFNLDEVITRR